MKQVFKTGILLVFGLLALAAIACSGEATQPASDSAATDVEGKPAIYEGPIFRDSMKQLAIKASHRNRELLEATIQQDGREISLALNIECAASEEKAKTTARFLGEELLRMIKKFGPDLDPTTSEIGTGEFDYLVGVTCADGTSIAKGAKASGSAEIVW